MCRQVNRVLWNKLDEFADSEAVGLYITGPQGIGKSHALYHCVCALRLHKDFVRVTYIQDCESWVTSHLLSPYHYLLRELCETFMDDQISTTDKKTIAEWAEWVEQAVDTQTKDDRFRALYAVPQTFVETNCLRWVSVFDQANALRTDRLTILGTYADLHFPFSMAFYFSPKVVISASANNDPNRKLPDNFLVVPLSATQYSDEEWALVTREIKDDPSLPDVEFWTNKVPLEFSKLNPPGSEGTKLETKLQVYKEQREKEMAEDHRRFLASLSSGGLLSFQDALAGCIHDVDVFDHTCIDRHLMFADHKKIRSITPLARHVMMQLSRQVDNTRYKDTGTDTI